DQELPHACLERPRLEPRMLRALHNAKYRLSRGWIGVQHRAYGAVVPRCFHAPEFRSRMHEPCRTIVALPRCSGLLCTHSARSQNEAVALRHGDSPLEANRREAIPHELPGLRTEHGRMILTAAHRSHPRLTAQGAEAQPILDSGKISRQLFS